MTLRVMSLAGSEGCGDALAARLGVAACALESRRFPDGEIYLRVADDVRAQHVAVVAQLRDPDPLLPGLLFLAQGLREMGASSVGLVAPYLPYMRQDIRFRPGEVVTSRSFATLASTTFSWLVTVDPHLHRIAALDEIYRIPTAVVASAPVIAAWVQGHVASPHLIGPDEESLQWVSEVAARAGCPCTVLRKHRSGDRSVELAASDLTTLRGRTPVLVDDIISSGRTLVAAAEMLSAQGLAAPVCIGVHAVFAGDALARLQAAGVRRVVSANTLPHPSNDIDVIPGVADAVRRLLHEQAAPVSRALPTPRED